MTTKDQVFQALADLPDDATIEDAIAQLNFLAKLKRRLAESDTVETFNQEEAKQRMARRLA
jgi:hypothetical protein